MTTPATPDSLSQLSQRLAQFAQARDWGQFHSPKNLASALVVEAGELLEPFQWLTDAQSRALTPEQLAAVQDEMADVLLYLVQLATVLDVDLLAAAQAKVARNELRYPADKARGSAAKHSDL
jgi:dCTP diphosphatase